MCSETMSESALTFDFRAQVRFVGRTSGLRNLSAEAKLAMPICAIMLCVDGAGILELLIVVAGQQQHGVFQLALAVDQRTLAELTDHQRRAEHDCRNQHGATGDKPPDRPAPRCHGDGRPARRGKPVAEIRKQSTHYTQSPDSMRTTQVMALTLGNPVTRYLRAGVRMARAKGRRGGVKA